MEKQNIEFDLIIGWISEHLKRPNDIVRSEGRNVFINTESGIKQIVIPAKDNKKDWQQAWLNVFEVCLYALQMKVNGIYKIGKKEGIIAQKSPNEVKVGHEMVRIPDDHNSVNYARSLEQIIKNYNYIKEQGVSPITVNHTTVIIDNPDKRIGNVHARVNTVKIPSSQGLMEPSMVKDSEDEKRVKTVRMTMARKSSENVSKSTGMNIQKIPANISLDKEDCEMYRELPLVIATCTSIKNDGVFRDNVDMLKTNVPSVSIGSFISGKAVNIDQASKEATRMLKLLNDCGVSKLVIYEVNNEYLNEHLDKKDELIQSLESSFKICDVLSDGGYYPMVCIDLETYDNAKEVINDYQKRHPIIKCVTPKQKDLVSDEDDILYMNPNSDNDVIRISNTLVQTNLTEIPKKAMRETYSMAA